MRAYLSARLVPATALALTLGISAQGQTVNGLGDTLLELNRPAAPPGQQRVLDQLFSGAVNATIFDVDLNNTNFAGADIIAFALNPVSGVGPGLTFTGTRAGSPGVEGFDAWVESNATEILAILFPGSPTQSVSGIDAAQGHSQTLLVSTVLAAGGRGNIGGRLEYEHFNVDRTSGNALQGLFRHRIVAMEARYARLHDTLGTQSVTIGTNVHPYWGSVGGSTEWRVGGDGYFSTLFSRSNALTMASLDYGGGVWASGRVNVANARANIRFGGLLLGSNSHIPVIDDDFEFVADTVNMRPIRWDATYGGALQYLVTQRVPIDVQLLQSRSVKSARDLGRTSELLVITLGYLRGGNDLIDFGYRFSNGGDGFTAHAIFMNANVTW